MVLNHKEMADDPPYSRLFVVYNRNDPVSESEIRSDFSPYGDIQDIFIVKDRGTGDPKGVAYVKYSKMSEAALALEKLNNAPIKNHTGTYRVYIAKSRGETRGPDHDDPDRYLRLFIMVPKSATESDIKHYFSKFGDVQTVKLLKHKDTNESKGIGYVTYSRIYEAAKAVEEGESESGFKAVIARPKEKSHPPETNASAPHASRSVNDAHLNGDFFHASVSSKLSKDNIFRLFDIAPGLRNIQVINQGSYRQEVIATYNSTLAAEYALNKLQGMEYPLGEYICVESKLINKSVPNTASIPPTSIKRDYRGEQVDFRNEVVPDANREVNQKLSALSKALTDATALLKSAGLSTETLGLDDFSDKWSTSQLSTSQFCSFPLPPQQKILPKTSFNEATGMRLFIVGHPAAPSLEALYDVYCRFGNFAGASILQRKNYGYLYYTNPENALKAIEATDEKMISGMSVKVLKAEPKGEFGHKRKKVDL